MYDVAIIGAGVIGCAIARELSRYEINACVIEREDDVCCGTSKANSAIIHAGFDATPGTLKAKLNVKGNAMMDDLSRDLDIPFKRNGSLVVCTKEQNPEYLHTLLKKGEENGVPGLEILNKFEAKKLEPNLADDVIAALYAPTGGIVCPFHFTIALAENAFANGISFFLNNKVEKIDKKDSCYEITTDKQTFTAKAVVNAAGVYADTISAMASKENIHITARKGEYLLLDKSAGTHVNHTIFNLPGKMGKGVLVTPTIHGNLLVGPTAVDTEDKDGTNTTEKGLNSLSATAALSVKDLPMHQVITSFAGLRAHEEGGDFILREADDTPLFFEAAGIESPGLSSAPAIGVMMAELIKDRLHLEKKPDFIATRKGILNPTALTLAERNELIRQQPAYGNIVCRCEMITEGEILDAIHRPLGARSLDGVKRRTRAGMGRCQSGFCSPRTMEILARELPLAMTEITKCGPKSEIALGHNKEI